MDCTYCGSPYGDTMDHVVPIAATHNGRKGNWDNGSPLVPCCKECNCLLGDKRYHSVAARAHYLADTLRRRYKKVMARADWDADELAEVGPSLRDVLLKQMHLAKVVEVRIAHCEHVALM